MRASPQRATLIMELQIVDDLNSRLDKLGWQDVPFDTVLTNIVWQYLAAGLSADVPLLQIGDDGAPSANRALASCRRALVSMLDEAERAGRLGMLARPHVRDPSEVLSLLEEIQDVKHPKG